MSGEHIAPPARRSCLSVPGSSAKMLAKAPGLPADELIVDLEDSVTPAAKDAARQAIADALASEAWAGVAVSVRVNAPRSPWCHLDIVALCSAKVRPQALIVPKVECPGDLAFVERLINGVEASRGAATRGAATGSMRIQALIENAQGLSAVQEIAASTPLLDSLILGYADLAASLGRSADLAGELDAWRFAQDALLLAARANGLQAIDGPYLRVAADEGFKAAAERAAGMGFDGKWAIHPSQLEHLNATFSPSEQEIEHARTVLAALERAERSGGAGAVAFEGQMLDEALAAAARRTLVRASSPAAARQTS